MPTPELALVSSGLTARFDGRRLLVAAGRITWTVPVRAIASATLTPEGTVLVEFAGPADDAAHGLGASVDLPAPNPTAAEAFHRSLARSVSAAKTAANGHELIERTEAPSRLASPGLQLAIRWAVPPLIYVLGLVLLGLISPQDGEWIAITLIFGGPAGAGGLLITWRLVRRVRSLWILRRRGVGVIGRATGDALKVAGSKGGGFWVFQKLSFTTAEGRRVRDANSVVSVFALSKKGADFDNADIVYDPMRPERAGRPLSGWFLLRTGFVTVAAFVLLSVFGLLVLSNLPL